MRIPKNASTSIYESLGTKNTIRDEKLVSFSQRHYGRYKEVLPPSHCLLSEAIIELGEEILNFPSFAVVRNPFCRMVSMYAFSIKSRVLHIYTNKIPSFLDFCSLFLQQQEENDGTFFPAFTQKSYITLGDGVGVNKILRLENLDKEFKNFIIEYSLTDIIQELPHTNSTTHESYTSYYCTESKKIVKKLWKEDLDEFKYTF